MKKLALFYCFLFISVSANAQPVERKKELTFSGTIVSSKTEEKIAGETQTNDQNYGILQCRLGFFITDAFAIEPEVSILVEDHFAPSLIGAVHGSYNTLIDEKVMVFIAPGVGIANSVPVKNSNSIKVTKGPEVFTFSVGGGFKYYLTTEIALRNELRYQVWNWENKTNPANSYSLSDQIQTTRKDLLFLMGFTVIL